MCSSDLSRLLLVMLALYALGILFGIRYSREEFPFFLYGMYSLKEEAQPVYTSYAVFIDGKEVKTSSLPDLQKELIREPFAHAEQLYRKGKLNEKDIRHLLSWLLPYAVDMRFVENNQLDIYKLSCVYNKAGKPEVIKDRKSTRLNSSH